MPPRGGSSSGWPRGTWPGSAGAVGGPLLLAGVLAAGGGWRPAYLLLAAAASAALAAAAIAGPARQAPADPAEAGEVGEGRRPAVRDVLAALRTGSTARWLVLLEASDLLLDVLTGYVGIYLVDVAHASPAEAAVGVAVRLGGGLAGDALFVAIARRVSGPAVLRVSADRGLPAVPGLPAGSVAAGQAGDPGRAEHRDGLLVPGHPVRPLHQPARPQ